MARKDLGEKVEKAGQAHTVAAAAVKAYTKELETRRRAEFEAAGGCERCRGRGWVVTWDTMDSMSGCYAEYGPCPDTKTNPEAHGPEAPLNHAAWNKYDGLRHVKVTIAQTEEEVAEVARLAYAADAAWKQYEYQKLAYTPMKGKTIRVVRGRKIARGIEGEVFWFGPDRYGNGNRVGIVTPKGEKYFTAAKNVEVI